MLEQVGDRLFAASVTRLKRLLHFSCRPEMQNARSVNPHHLVEIWSICLETAIECHRPIASNCTYVFGLGSIEMAA